MIETATTRPELRRRIVEVAAALLHDQGAGAVTTRRVAEGADVQAPTIYRLFGDKDGLLEAVAEHVLATHVSAKAVSVEVSDAADLDPVAALRSGWDWQIEFALDNPAVFALLVDPTRAASSEAARLGQLILQGRVRRLAEAGVLRVGEQRAVDVIQSAGVGVIQLLLSRPVGERDPALADVLFEAVLGRILTDRAVPRVDGARADHSTVGALVAVRAAVPNLAVLTPSERQLLGDWLDRAIEHS